MEVGEICIRGPQVMAGYWNRPDETEKAMTSDGFFRSGDMGYMDERGYTKIVDRKKDMILVSGFNVYPNEIEEVAMEHVGIREAAAIGVPNEHSGEIVKLFIVRKDPALTEEAVKAFCAERLTNYKRPRIVEFRDELPKSNVGKILRRELRIDRGLSSLVANLIILDRGEADRLPALRFIRQRKRVLSQKHRIIVEIMCDIGTM